MLTEKEINILGLFEKQLLLRKDDLKRILSEQGFSDGVATANRLAERGYLKFIEAVGAPCYTITQEGLRTIKSE